MSRSILIVDDDPRIRTSLSEALRDEATEVRTAESGEDALSRLGEAAADLVLADLRMPGMDGIELLRVLRSDEALASLELELSAHREYSEIKGRYAQICASIIQAVLGKEDPVHVLIDLNLLREASTDFFEENGWFLYAGRFEQNLTDLESILLNL